MEQIFWQERSVEKKQRLPRHATTSHIWLQTSRIKWYKILTKFNFTNSGMKNNSLFFQVTPCIHDRQLVSNNNNYTNNIND